MKKLLSIFPLGYGVWMAGMSLFWWNAALFSGENLSSRWVDGGMASICSCVGLGFILFAGWLFFYA